jgi:hypothetical protein
MKRLDRRKCINALIDAELDDYSYNSFKDLFANAVIYGTKNEPYYKMDDASLLECLYDAASHDLETFDEEAMIDWLSEQEPNDWMGRLE